MRQMTRVSLAGLAAALTLAGCSGAKEEVETVAVRATEEAPSGSSLQQTTRAQATGALSRQPGAGADSPAASATSPVTNFESAGLPAPAIAGWPSSDPATDRPETSEPVTYADKAGDATGGVPHGGLNQASFDILRVDWAPVARGDDHRRGYSTSMTVAGAPREDGSYVSYGQFRSRGEWCQIYYILPPGATAYANAFCGTIDGGTRRFIGRVEGGRVTSTPTAGGTTLTAIFEDPALPSELEAAGRRLYDLGAFTALCAAAQERPGECKAHETLDDATSRQMYRV